MRGHSRYDDVLLAADAGHVAVAPLLAPRGDRFKATLARQFTVAPIARLGGLFH